MGSRNDHSRENVTIVLVGHLGSGKSSTGNSILSGRLFKVKTGTVGITDMPQEGEIEIGGVKIQVIDTPGIESAAEFSTICTQIKRMLKYDYVVTAIVIKVGRYTEEERKVLEELFKKHKKLLKHPMLIFANRDELDDEDDPVERHIDSWVRKNPSLCKMIKDNNLTYTAFKNRDKSENENRMQVDDLLLTIFGENQTNPSAPVKDPHKRSYPMTIDDQEETVSFTREELKQHFGESGAAVYDRKIKQQW